MTDRRFDPPPLAAARGPVLPGESVLGLLERAMDTEGIEALLLDLAVHPQGFGAPAACVLRWIEERREFVLARSARPSPGGPDLAETLRGGSVRRSALEDGSPEPGPLPIETLPPLLERAWRSPAPVSGELHGEGLPFRGAFGAFTLARGITPHGLFVVADPGRADFEGTLARLQGFARASFDAHQRQECARQRRRHASALSEMARASVSALNVAEVLRLVVRLAAATTGSHGCALWLATPEGLRLEATHGPAGQRESMGRALQNAARRAVEDGRVRERERAADEPLLAPDAAAQLERFAIVPVAAYGRTLGALAVYERAGHPARAELRGGDIEFLAALADQLAIALDQARRFDALRDVERRLDEQRGWSARLERLARAGEESLETLQAARHPVASIRAFARRLQKSLAEDDPNRDHLDVVIRESERLERLLESRLESARGDGESLRLETLNASIQEVLQEVGETLVRRRVRLLKRLAPDLPTLLLDGERVRLVLRNIVRQALEEVPVGGRVRIESRRVERHVVVDVAHDGPRRPGDLIERLFAPFSTDADGRETGLTAAHRIVRQHGGEVRIRTEAEWGSIVTFTLPVAGNEERRRNRERRERRNDRRTARAAGSATPFARGR